ncbi:MAG: hypothetical protein J7521_16725 [Caulobacter sp.]|nr:hypothetical protein [Caulobacter sp.]
MASTPTPTWDGARLLGVQCLLAPDDLADRRRLQGLLCERVRALAADKAPIPVTILQPGDPRLIEDDTAVLLIHASVQPQSGGKPLLVLAARSFRATAAPSELFGATPRAVPMAPDVRGPQIDAALNAALAEILPWRVRPHGPRPLPPPRRP